MENLCVLDDFITNDLYSEILKENNIVFASPMYMSNINGIFKNLLDRLNPFYNHKLLEGKNIYLIMSGYATKEENEEEINGIIEYFKGISEYWYFNFEFLDYFVDSNESEIISENERKIKDIKERLSNF